MTKSVVDGTLLVNAIGPRRASGWTRTGAHDHFSFLAADAQLHRRFLTSASTGLVNILFGQHLQYSRGPASIRGRSRALPKTAGGFCFLTQMHIHALHGGYPRGSHSRLPQGRVPQEHPESGADDSAASWTIRVDGASVARRV